MANSGGGVIVFGVNDDGSPTDVDLSKVLANDPVTIVDKVSRYTGQQYAGCRLSAGDRHGQTVVILCVAAVPVPMVFTAPGTYDGGGGKQKQAFARGTVYFRHGAKSEPGTTQDLAEAVQREVNRIRSDWLDGIAKIVTAPVGAVVKVLPGQVTLSGAADATAIRLVTDDSAPAFNAVRTDRLYPYRQKELVARVNALLGTPTITAHDVHCVRKTCGVDENPTFFYKPQYSSPQYSEA